MPGVKKWWRALAALQKEIEADGGAIHAPLPEPPKAMKPLPALPDAPKGEL